MKDSLTHDQLEQLLPAAALEILEGDELLDLTVHVRECADCERLLESYREVLAGWATDLPERAFEPARDRPGFAAVCLPESDRARRLRKSGCGLDVRPGGAIVGRDGPWQRRWRGCCWCAIRSIAGNL